MATITPPTPVDLTPTPEMVSAVRRWHAAHATMMTEGRLDGLSRAFADAVDAERQAWLDLVTLWPKSLGWYRIGDWWWAWSKVSKHGLELVHRRELPRGLRARLATH